MKNRECPKCGGDMKVELHEYCKYFVCQNLDCEYMEEYDELFELNPLEEE